jgi:hypothetical protein
MVMRVMKEKSPSIGRSKKLSEREREISSELAKLHGG